MRLNSLSHIHAVPLTDLHYQLMEDLIERGETDLLATPARLMHVFALAEPDQAELAMNAWRNCQQTLSELGCAMVFFSLKLHAYVNQQNRVIQCARQDFLSPDRQRFTQTPAITLSCGVLIRSQVFEVSYTYAVDYPFIILANRVAMIWASSYFCSAHPFPWQRIKELAR